MWYLFNIKEQFHNGIVLFFYARRKEKTMAKISAQYQAFAKKYIENFNGTEAAIFAGYSPKSARTQGSRMLQKVDVQNYISKLVDEKAMGYNERLLALGNIARTAKSTKDRMKAIELLGKLSQDYTKKIDLTSNGKDFGVNIYLPDNARD